MFYSNCPIYCPECKPIYRSKLSSKEKVQVGPCLELVERNYSGCGVDIASCENCKTEFFITYKIDKITEIIWNE